MFFGTTLMIFLIFMVFDVFCFGDFVVYEVVGKQIQQCFVSNKTDKKTKIYWDGKDDRGFEIRSGLYFVRFESNNGSIIKKVTYLK